MFGGPQKKGDPRASITAVVQKNVRVWAFSFNMEARDPFMGDDPNQVRAARIAVKGRLPGQGSFRQNQLTWVAHRCSRHAFPDLYVIGLQESPNEVRATRGHCSKTRWHRLDRKGQVAAMPRYSGQIRPRQPMLPLGGAVQ